jgi:hypothetical protein
MVMVIPATGRAGRRIRVLAGLLALVVAGCVTPVPYTTLEPDLSPLSKAFNADAGRTRVLAIVSPTCDPCLRGLTAVQEQLFAQTGDPRLQPYVVWVPKVRGQASSIAVAAQRVPDPRVRHFWDARGRLMNAYQEVLGIGEDAWDVFLVYGPDTRWDGTRPPAPRLWMHQLGPPEKPRVRGRYLDVAAFASETRAILHAPPPSAPLP